jgi:hypothetical protein
MPPPSDTFNNDRSDRFAFAKQYAEDIARSNRELAPFVELERDSNYPTCASCSRPLFHDYDERKYRCNFCIITIKEDFIQYSPHNKNRKYKDLSEMAVESKSREAQELATAADNQYNSIRESKARLATKTGEDNDTGGYDSNTSGSKPVFYQLPSPHDIVRKQRNAESGRYTDFTRTSLREKDTLPVHPLDAQMLRENPNMQIKKSVELDSVRQPNSSGIVNKSKRVGDNHRPYSRYMPDDGTTPDVYDQV